MPDASTVDARVWFTLLGVLLGFSLGYAVGAYKTAKRLESRMGRVEQEVGMSPPDERGAITLDRAMVQFIGVLLAIIATVIAVVSTAQTNNRVQDNVYCNKEFLTKTLDALNTRTQSTGQQLDQQQTLNQSQLEFLRALQDLQPMDPERAKRLNVYIQALEENKRIIARQQFNRRTATYPTAAEIARCTKEG